VESRGHAPEPAKSGGGLAISVGDVQRRNAAFRPRKTKGESDHPVLVTLRKKLAITD
jgi:hypothetical protein